MLCVRCPGPLGSGSPLCPLGGLCCVCGVLGHLAPVHRCVCVVCCVACAVSWAAWLLFTVAPALCLVLRVRCPKLLRSRSSVSPLGVLCSSCGVLGHLATVHRRARSVLCFACVVSWATWLLFTDVPARCVAGRVRCPGRLGCRSPVCPLSVLCCVCGVLGHLDSVQRCDRSVLCFACAVSWATFLLFTGVPAGCLVLQVRCVACAVSWATWLLFTGVPPRWTGLRVQCPRPLGSCSPVCPLGGLCCVCGVLGQLAPVHWCACMLCCVVCAVSWAAWLLFTGAPAWFVVLRVRCPGPLDSCSPVCPLGVLCCVCGVLGHLATVHRCARLVCCVACAVSWATWLMFTGVPPRWAVLRVRCPGPLGSCSPLCLRGLLCCVCGVLGRLAPAHQCARSVSCVACAVSWATCFCSPVCPFRPLLCLCAVLGHMAPVHRCALPVRCLASAVSWTTWLLFTGVPTPCVVLCVRCPGPLGSCSPVCPLGVLCCVCGILGHLAPVHRCARLVGCVACTVSWATWLLFTSVPAWFVLLHVRCPGPLGSCSPVRLLGVSCCLCLFCPLLCLCCVLGPVSPVHRCARLVRRFACTVSWATWLPFTGVPRQCVVVGHLAPVHHCARSVSCVACAASWETWLLFTGVPALSFALLVRCPGPRFPSSPVCPLGVLCCVCGVLGHLAPVHRCGPSVGCVAFAVSWATWLLFTGVPPLWIVLPVQCPGPLGPCSPVCLPGLLCCMCGVLGCLAAVHRCARVVRCVACAETWATWLPLTSAPAQCLVLRVRCPGPLGSCSPVCPPGWLCCVCGVLGHLAPVHQCARWVCCVACAVSLATWLLVTCGPVPSFALLVWCSEPRGSCSPVCPLGALLGVCGVVGHLAALHR